jgi:glycosyltransferase involved in cell wall biosynthesis
MPISVVIITKNEAEAITACIYASRKISNDIIVIDNDSTDGTPEIAHSLGCKVYHEEWDGYGANKNKGIAYARYDWILSIDADEIPDEELIRSLHDTELNDPNVVYDIAFRSYYGSKAIRFGSWGRDHHIRLFNRKIVKWTEPAVHETLTLSASTSIKKLKGHMHHYSVKNRSESLSKIMHYARLSAEKYYLGGKKARAVKLHLAPPFHFIKNYIVFLGFLDGQEGLDIARMISKHTRLKYRLLKKMQNRNLSELPHIKETLAVEY